MTERFELYKCDVCGNIVEVVVCGGGELVCCGQPMKLLSAGVNDEAATEKHVPVIERIDNDVIIRVGSEPHPMIPAHYIMFIETISQDGTRLTRQYLQPDDEPAMKIKHCDGKFIAKEYCNIHGLWEAQSD